MVCSWRRYAEGQEADVVCGESTVHRGMRANRYGVHTTVRGMGGMHISRKSNKGGDSGGEHRVGWPGVQLYTKTIAAHSASMAGRREEGCAGEYARGGMRGGVCAHLHLPAEGRGRGLKHQVRRLGRSHSQKAYTKEDGDLHHVAVEQGRDPESRETME